MPVEDIKENEKYYTELNPSKWDLVKQKLSDWFGCIPPFGIAYKSYNLFAGKLECMCCIFWRGIFIGLALGLIIGWGIF